MSIITRKAPAIIVPGSSEAPTLELLNNPRQLGEMLKFYESTLEKSFLDDYRRLKTTNSYGEYRAKITQHEAKRRVDIMGRWFKIMRAELGYSLSKTKAEIPRALRAELDGKEYNPPPREKAYLAAESTNVTVEATEEYKNEN